MTTVSSGLKKQIFYITLSLGIAVCWLGSAIGLTKDEVNTIKIYKKASEGVVNISSVVLKRDFFYGVVPREGAGSGAVIDDRGYILTNNHVIMDARRIEVTFSDGSKYQGGLVGTDPDNDLAVIKVTAPANKLHVLELGESNNLMVGQKVMAIGNPFGLNETLTTGIISSLGRSIQSQNGGLMEDLIQTDAAINPGNSGGPLLDSDGRIIGINTAIFSPSGGSVGIGFAIPVDVAKRIIPDLIEKGYVAYPWIGVSLYPLIPWIANALELEVDRGAMVAEVVRHGPADKAGLRGSTRFIQVRNVVLPVGGDIIVAIDEKAITSSEELIRGIRKHRSGDRVRLKILRNSRFRTVKVTLGERPRN